MFVVGIVLERIMMCQRNIFYCGRYKLRHIHSYLSGYYRIHMYMIHMAYIVNSHNDDTNVFIFHDYDSNKR